MKYLVLVLLSIVAITSAQEYVAGKTVYKRFRAGRAGTELVPADVCRAASGTGTFCLTQDDHCASPASYFICKNGEVLLDKTVCGDSTPYCLGEPGSQFCSAEPDPAFCAQINPICRNEGYFPEPANCSYYYYCYYGTDGKIISIQKQCPAGAPFTPVGPQDRKCLVGGTCVRANCTAGLKAEWRALNYVNFTTNRLAMKCSNSILDFVNLCPAGLSIDTTYTAYAKCSIKCEYNYQKAAYPTDNTKYYLCLLGNATLETCEPGQVFNPNTLNCEKA